MLITTNVAPLPRWEAKTFEPKLVARFIRITKKEDCLLPNFGALLAGALLL
jgi:hypothetical protein